MFTSYANRGMAFEQAINFVNEQYKNHGLAFIEKKPTPMKIIRTQKKKGFFTCVFEKKSSVDYSGICHGRAIYFDAKTTKNRTRFALDMIPDHQVETLRLVKEQGGIGFFLIEFNKFHEVYVLTIDQLLEWMEQAENGGRKSIPYEWIVEHCALARHHEQYPIHYLDCLGVLD